MTARCTCYGGNICPAHDLAIDEAEWERDLGDPMSDRDWDELEAGRLWSSYPGMGAA